MKFMTTIYSSHCSQLLQKRKKRQCRHLLRFKRKWFGLSKVHSYPCRTYDRKQRSVGGRKQTTIIGLGQSSGMSFEIKDCLGVENLKSWHNFSKRTMWMHRRLRLELDISKKTKIFLIHKVSSENNTEIGRQSKVAEREPFDTKRPKPFKNNCPQSRFSANCDR